MNRSERRRQEKLQRQQAGSVSSYAVQAVLRDANTAQDAGNLREAESILRSLLAKEPKNADALYMIGLLYRKGGANDLAIEHLQRAMRAAPKRAAIAYELGNTFKLLGENSKAAQCYREVLRTNPREEAVHNNLGLALQEQGCLREAICCYTNALSINPEFVDSYNNLGTALHALGDNEAALACFRNAVGINPASANAHYNTYPLLIAAEDIPGAISALENAVVANPGHYPARIHLGIWLDYQGHSTEAKKHFSFIEEHAPHFRHDLDSWAYIKSHLASGAKLHADSFQSIKLSFAWAGLEGMVLEFGVRYGLSINFLATLTDQTIHGFDSFEGLPEEWLGMDTGAYSTHGRLPKVAGNVQLHAGWFSETLPAFVASHDGRLKYMNVDCDIYSSTRTVFDHIGNRIDPGTVIIFDEYICNPNWRNDEYKAFQEFVANTGLRYRYLLFSPYSKQTAVLIE